MEDRIFQLVVEQNDVTWKTIILDLVKTEQMDPWNVNVSLLAQRYIEMLGKLKEMDFKLSGKIVLAATLLLKIKSSKLIKGDLDEFDRLLAATEEEMTQDEFYDGLSEELKNLKKMSQEDRIKLVPRTPLPRKRKVSVYDLVNALEKALEVKKRRIVKSMPKQKIELPEKSPDITLVIKQTYKKILDFFMAGKKLTFSNLVPSRKREDMIYTLRPLLHLSSQRKIDLEQQKHFGEIDVKLVRGKKPSDSVANAMKEQEKKKAENIQ